MICSPSASCRLLNLKQTGKEAGILPKVAVSRLSRFSGTFIFNFQLTCRSRQIQPETCLWQVSFHPYIQDLADKHLVHGFTRPLFFEFGIGDAVDVDGLGNHFATLDNHPCFRERFAAGWGGDRG